MQITKIFNNWGNIITTGYDDIMNVDTDYLTDLLINRNLLLFRGLTRNLTDDQYYDFGQKFGKVWTLEEYQKPYIVKGRDKTLNINNPDKPVSYFQTQNNIFGNNHMLYHADMPHINELSYPGRLLYMIDNPSGGTTTWLNLEEGWRQLSQNQKDKYQDLEVVNHDMYVVETRMEIFPFTKTNPKTGKISPRLNCWYWGKKKDGNDSLGWIHHIRRDGQDLNFTESSKIITNLYTELESMNDTVYCHEWIEGDIIVYDNWFNVHKRDPIPVNNNEPRQRLLKRLTFNFI